MTPGRGKRRLGVIAWIALVVLVAIWTEHRIAGRADPPRQQPAAQRAPTAQRRANQPTAPRSALTVERPLRLEGHVIDPDGRDVEGAGVGLAIDGDVGAAPPWLRATSAAVAQTTSDAGGRFVFDAVEPRRYLVTATAGSLIAAPVHCDAVDTGDARRPVVIRLVAGASATITVTDQTGAPVPAALVDVLGSEPHATGETDAQGRATVAPIQPGYLEVTVVAQGFALGSRGLWLTSPGEHADAAITLYRGVPVSGRVVDDHRQPIAGARIAVSGRWTRVDSTSDERGEFASPALIRGPYTLDITAEGRPPVRTTVNVERTAVTGVEITMASGAMITGIVVDSVHRPVPRATVTGYVHGVAVQATSDPSGNFELRGIPPGRITLRAETATAQSGEVSTTIAATSDAPDIEIVLEFAATITGIVVDDNGSPLAGIPVTAIPDYHHPGHPGQAPTYGHATSDDTGAFVLAGLSDMAFVVFARRLDVQSARWPPPGAASARAGDRDVRVTLPTGGRATGRLVDESGAPIGDARIGLASSGATTDRDGAFVLRGIEPGSYDVRSMLADVVSVVRQGVEIRRGETSELGTLTAPRSHGRTLAGRVVDTAGVPIGNVCVELGVIRPPPVEEDDPPGGFKAHRTAYTAPDGVFRIPNIPPTAMLARATDPAYRSSATIAIPTAAVSPDDPAAITLVVSSIDAR